MASTVLPNGIIIPEKYSRDWYSDLYHNWQELDNLLGGGTPKDGTLTIQKNGTDIGTFSANQATNETINIEVPDVNNGTLTIQKNGSTVGTFSANQATNETINIEVPDVNNGTLTIQQNGTAVDTFTANSSSDKTVNIQCVDLASNQTIAGNKEFTGTTTAHDVVPSATDTYNFGSSAAQWNNAYIKSLTINGTAAGDILTHNASEFVPRSGGAVLTGNVLGRTNNTHRMVYCGGVDYNNGANVTLYGKDSDSFAGVASIQAYDGVNSTYLRMFPTGEAKFFNNGTTKNLAMQEDTVPRSGGSVITGTRLAKSVDNSGLRLDGGSDWNKGGSVVVNGQGNSTSAGTVYFHTYDGTNGKNMYLKPDGTWTWDGTACQITSDQRYKQQINAIDDKLLDAWEDVELSQFKYNDAVEEKGTKARLHTGYVVQQIQKACESHGVDISQYGLFCHEEYPEETEEVEVEQKDGTKTKERKVIREASEHYSLRYTEALIVECKYLRKCIKELRNEIEELKSSK